MKKLFAILILGAACLGARAQQINGDFDGTWEDCIPWDSKGNAKKSGTQPVGWRISNVFTALGAVEVGSNVQGVSGDGTAVKLSNKDMVGQLIPGYLTLGTPWATAETKGTTVRNADGGTFGGISFSYKPDALSFDYQRDNSKGTSESAVVVAYLWSGTWIQKDVPGNTAVGYFSYGTATKVDMTDRDRNVLGMSTTLGGDITSEGKRIASLQYSITQSTNNDWKHLILDFEYDDINSDVEKANIIFSANDYFGDRSSIVSGNSLTIDNVKFIYYHSLTSCTYDGQSISFDDNNAASVNALYDESKLAYEKKGVGATVEKAYNKETGVLTITVKGNDYEADNTSVTTYTIQFKKPSDVASEKTYTETLYVTIDGETSEPQDANVLVQNCYDGNFNFVLKNFMLGSGADALPVGNINVPNLSKNDDGSFAYQGIINIEAGDLEGVANDGWLGPMLGDVPLDLKGQFVDGNHLRVSIYIDMSEKLEQIIYVHLGYDAASLAVKPDAQYGTFCAPFDVTIPEGVIAYTISGIDENGKLVLEQQSAISAHIPVIVESTSGIDAVQFGVATTGEAKSAYLTGVYTATPAPVGSYVLQKQNDRVGFYQVQEGKQPIVGANRAYLDLTNSPAGVKAFYMEDATAIQAVEELLSGKAEIYDLAGRRQQKLQKGINIVGGKKVLVK